MERLGGLDRSPVQGRPQPDGKHLSFRYGALAICFDEHFYQPGKPVLPVDFSQADNALSY